MIDGTDTPPLITAQALVPAGEQLAFSVQLRPRDCLCLIGTDSKRLVNYLRSLAGVETPQTGNLHLFGRALEAMDKKSWREQRQHIGYVARSAPLLSVLRGLDNVMLPALYHKRMTRSEAREMARQLLAEVGCQGDINKLPAFLTPQQRLQLAIARATILGPPLLFIEDPFYGLSLAESQSIFQYLIDSRERRTLALTTHDLRLVRDVATQILFIGEQSSLHFDSWEALTRSEDQELMQYLTRYQMHFQVL